MKRIFSILLLIVFLFNVGGYYVVFLVLRSQANAELTARLDADQYSEDELVEIRVPVNLPYPLQEQGFRRVDGRFEHNGQFYKMVKHKLDNDVLIIVCIKDQEEKKLDQTMRDYSKLANDLPAAPKKTQNILSKLLKDFESLEDGAIVHGNTWQRTIEFASIDFITIDRASDLSVPPPRS